MELINTPYGSVNFVLPERNIGMRATLASCGREWRRSPTYSWDGLSRGDLPFFIWQFTLKGRGIVENGMGVFEIPEGHAMIVHVPERHRYYVRQGDEWDFIFVTMGGSELLRVSSSVTAMRGPVAAFPPGSATLAAACAVMERTLRGPPPSPYTVSALAYGMAMAIAEDLSPGFEKREGHAPSPVEMAVRFCVEKLSEDIGVDDMAAAAGLSRYYFTRIFTKAQGLPPAVFLKELRLRKALGLLQNARSGVKEVAVQCGFDDVSYFCKQFKKSFGSPPGKFRKGGQGGVDDVNLADNDSHEDEGMSQK